MLFQNGGFITFVLAESLCFFLIVHYNTRQGEVWDNTFGIVSGNLLEQRRKAMRYSHLPEVVDSLMWENALLKQELINRQTMRINLWDTAYSVKIDSVKGILKTPEFSLIPANVVSNTVHLDNNWVILNRGAADGVTRHSGVISKDGVVGIVRHVDQHFCIAMSVLHQQMRLSAALRGQLGSLVWKGGDPTTMELNDIPKDIEPQIGDSVLTSGFSSMFPKRHLVGRVAGKELPMGSNFYSIQVKLSQNPGSVDAVYIVNNLFARTLDSLQTQVNHE